MLNEMTYYSKIKKFHTPKISEISYSFENPEHLETIGLNRSWVVADHLGETCAFHLTKSPPLSIA